MTNKGFAAQGIGMGDFARFLGNKLGVAVADETGLARTYDIHVRWDVQLGHVANAEASDETADALRVAAFRAVEQQLGWKLRSKKVAVPAVVIDHAQKPAAADTRGRTQQRRPAAAGAGPGAFVIFGLALGFVDTLIQKGACFDPN